MAKINAQFQLHMPAGKATPAPPIGPILGQHGLNIGTFVKEFNDATNELVQQYGGAEIRVPVDITVYVDRSYDMKIQPPVTTDLILWKVGQKGGSGEPNKNKIGTLTDKDLEEIAEIKKPVMNTRNTEAIKDTIKGSASSIGVQVE